MSQQALCPELDFGLDEVPNLEQLIDSTRAVGPMAGEERRVNRALLLARLL